MLKKILIAFVMAIIFLIISVITIHLPSDNSLNHNGSICPAVIRSSAGQAGFPLGIYDIDDCGNASLAPLKICIDLLFWALLYIAVGGLKDTFNTYGKYPKNRKSS